VATVAAWTPRDREGRGVTASAHLLIPTLYSPILRAQKPFNRIPYECLFEESQTKGLRPLERNPTILATVAVTRGRC
jgi:hypothetical protein